MPVIPIIRFSTLFIAVLGLATVVISGPSGINCEGKGCGWDCPGAKSCSQAFADAIHGVDNGATFHDGQEIACMPDGLGDGGLCAYIYGLGSATTTGSNLKLVAQDLANHCSECGQAPIDRSGNNLRRGGWLQIESTDSKVCSTTYGGLSLCG